MNNFDLKKYLAEGKLFEETKNIVDFLKQNFEEFKYAIQDIDDIEDLTPEDIVTGAYIDKNDKVIESDQVAGIQGWGLDFSFDRKYVDNEYTINRNVEIKATSDYDYLTIYKSLLPGTISADYSEYNYVSFTAKGSGLMELGLIKASIEDWKQQYRVMVDLSKEEQTYYVPFDIYTSVGTQDKIVANDLTTLTFTFLPVEAQTKELDLFISNVKFVKTAGSDGITLEKQETYENELMAYPNPSLGNVNLLLFSKNDTEATVTLTDVTGKTIHKSKAQLTIGKNELAFDFKVKTGIYLLKVSSSEATYGTTKIIFR